MAAFFICLMLILSVLNQCSSQYCDADGINCKKGDYYDMEGKLLVAAIDLGTSYSGWAHAFKDKYTESKDQIDSCIKVKRWYSDDHVSLKAPTTVLIKPDGETLDSFGYDAEERYSKLAANETHRNYYYFNHFKMLLDARQDLTAETTMKDETGREFPAIKVFSLAIRFLKEDLMETLRGQILNLEESHIRWVLTVPAIWSEKAKQFMRKAAVQAGINDEDLNIALEPEAASLYSRKLTVQKLETEDGYVYTAPLRSGDRYMVIDAGGGTVDITVHEILKNGHLKEILSADGGPWGGTKVNAAFLNMLTDLLGDDVILEFKRNSADDYLDLMRDFEVKKRRITHDTADDIIIRLPESFHDVVKRLTGKTIAENIEGSAFNGKLHQKKDKLYINPELCKSFFETAIQNIISKIKSLLKEPSASGTSALLLVGGFSESKLLQDSIKSGFPDYNRIIPPDAGLVVLKGAVIFGYEPYIISERVSRFTYGVAVSVPFIEGTHDPKKKFFGEDEILCRNIFQKFVEKGETLKLGISKGNHMLIPVYSDQKSMNVSVHSCSKISPFYSTDEGCNQLGHVYVKIRDTNVPKTDRKVKISFTFGDTEIKVTALEMRTGIKTSAEVNFLEYMSR